MRASSTIDYSVRKYFRLDELEAVYGIKMSYARKLIAEGEFAASQLRGPGGVVLVSRQTLEDYIESKKTPTGTNL